MTVVVVAVTLHSPTPVAPAQAQHSPGRGLPSTVRSPSFDWPLTPRPRVVRPFDPPTSPYGPGHRGVDLAAAPGQPVLAAAEGRIVHAGTVAGIGVVSIQHDGGLRTTYEPVRASPEDGVTPGTRVTSGERIGTVAGHHAGCPTVACLHWGVRRGEEYLDPLEFVPPAGPLRLKPWPDEASAGPS